MCSLTKNLGRSVLLTMCPLDNAFRHYTVHLLMPEAGHFWYGPCVRLVYRTWFSIRSCCDNHRVHTEWQRPLSGVHYIMRGGGACPPPFTLFTITYKVAVYAPAERADTLTLCHLLNVLCDDNPSPVCDCREPNMCAVREWWKAVKIQKTIIVFIFEMSKSAVKYK